MRRLKIVHTIVLIVVLISTTLSLADTDNHDYGIIKNQNSPHAKLKSVDLKDVRWTDGFWAVQFVKTRDVTLPRLWELASDPEKGHAIQNLRIAAGIETGTQRFFPDGLDFGNSFRSIRLIDAQKAETAGVTVFQRRCIRKTDNRMCVFIAVKCPGVIKKATAHSKVNEPEHSRLQLNDQIFPATQHPPYLTAPKFRGKAVRHRSAQGLTRKRNAGDSLAGYGLSQLPGEGFNFRHLRHFALFQLNKSSVYLKA